MIYSNTDDTMYKMNKQKLNHGFFNYINNTYDGYPNNKQLDTKVFPERNKDIIQEHDTNDIINKDSDGQIQRLKIKEQQTLWTVFQREHERNINNNIQKQREYMIQKYQHQEIKPSLYKNPRQFYTNTTS